MKVKPAGKQSPSVAANEPIGFQSNRAWQQSSGRARLTPWQGNAFCAGVTAATLGLRLALDAQLKDRPTLIVFTLPIMLSAYVGGLTAGLLATAISCVGAGYFLLPPVHTFRIEAGVDRWDLFFLALAGVVISVLNEALHRARRRAAVASGELLVRKALVKAQALQSAIFNSTGFSSIATDEKGVIQIFNVGAERMLGYTAAEVVHKLTPAEMADPQEMIARAQALSLEFKSPIAPGLETLIYKASRGMEYVYEPTLIRKDGSRFPAVVSVAALRDAQDAIIGYLLIGTDNTARKHAEEARLASEARYRTLFEHAPDGIVIANSGSFYLDANPSMCQMLGFTRDEMIGKHASEIVATSEVPRIGEAFGAINSNSKYEREWKFRRKDGSIVRAEVFATAMPDGNLMAVIRDITARKRAEEDRERFFKLSQDVMGALAFDGYFKDLNPAWEATLGFTRAELLATPNIELVHPDDRPATLAGAQRVFGGASLIAFENRYRCKDGTYRWFQWNVTPVMDDRVMYGVARDVTERKQTEAALLKAGTLQRAIFNSANFSSIATDAKGVIQIFNVGAERMLGYTAGEVMNKITPADISDPQEVIVRAEALTLELGTPIKPGFEALVFKASRGIEDIYELTYIRRDGSRFPAVVSVTALRDAQDAIIGYLLIGTDNTARKQAEEALLQAGALQRAIFNSANFSSIATDAKGVIQIFNVGAERMLGYTAAEVMNKITPADISDPQEVVSRAQALSLELGTPIKPGFEALVFKASRGIEDIYELTYIHKDGTRFPAVVSVTALRDAQEEIIGYLLIGTDNSARKLAEEARQMSEARVAGIVNSAMDAIISIDAAQNIVLFNSAAERMFALTAEAAMGQPLEKLIPKRFHEKHHEYVDGFGRTGTTSRSMQSQSALSGVRSNGEEFPIEASISQLEFAGKKIFTVILRDITQRRREEQATRTSEGRLRMVTDNARVGLVMVDAERRYTFANSTYAEILGLMSPDIVGQRVADVLSSLYEEQIRPRLDRAFAGERVTYELRRPTADGIRHYLVRYEPPKADDSVPQVVVVINDLTERKRAEEELSRTAEHLRLFAEHAPASIAMLDAQMRYVVVSQRWLADYGFVGQDLRGRNHYAMFPEVSQRWKQIHRRCLEGAVERAEEDLFERADGTKQWVRWEVRPWFEASGDTGGIVIFSEDITARKRAEARLRRLVDSNVQGVLFWNTKGCITDANDAFLSMFGYDRSDVEAGRLDWAKMTPPQYVDRDRQALEDLAVEGLCAPYEKEFFRQDGSRVPILIGSATFEDNPQEGVSFVLDLTERKQAEEKVRLLNAELEQRIVQRTSQLQTANTELKAFDDSLFASEERYRSLVENAREYAIFALDIHGNITSWNAGAQRIKGYRADEIIGKHFSILYAPADAQLGKPQKELDSALETGQYEEDGWRIRKSGDRYWANVLITALRDRHGNHLGFSKIVRDLTDRKKAEEKLRESEEWLRSLVEGGKKYAIVTLDPEGNVTTWNAGAQRIKGYRAGEVIGKHFSLFYTPEDVKRGKPQKELKIAAELGQYEEDGWRVRKDGSLFWANVLLTVLRDSHGKHLGFSKVTRDLTDTVRAEEQARSFFSVSLEMLCIAGFDGYFKLLNPVWEQTLGFTPEELCATPFRDFVHPDDMAATDAAATELSTGKLLNHFENRYRCKDGSYRWLAWNVAVSADRQFMYAAAADITERRRTESEIVSLNETLLRQNFELDSTNKELESFSYSVSHDLRAPLRAIDGFSQALSEDCADKLNAEGQDSLGRIRGASQRMGHLIDDLLDLSRLSRAEMKREEVDLSRMAREILKDLQEGDPQRHVDCLIANGLTADADPRLLHVVLTNLLANAWKFSAKCPDSRIEFGSARVEGNNAFFVRDNGAGFDMAYAGKLFGAFQRLHSREDFAGTGVGLATVQRIVHRHHGRVWAQSAVGSGATFHFTLRT